MPYDEILERMGDTRRTLLEVGRLKLTKEEIAAGWHYCPEWGYVLIGPGDAEMDMCRCFA